MTPSASLTVISKPLEAMVYIDGREVGTTPVTLQHLDPGRCELVLVKDGHPRTARTIHLKPGSKRVLEIELGTKAEDEAAGPGRAEGSRAGPPAPEGMPLEVRLVFTMLKDDLIKRREG